MGALLSQTLEVVLAHVSHLRGLIIIFTDNARGLAHLFGRVLCFCIAE